MSRYYDPVVGRFINADAYVSTGQGILGYNMFAYCLNNPVNMVDQTGAKCICLTKRVGLKHVCTKKNTQQNSFPFYKFKNDDGIFSLYDNHRFDPDAVFHEQIFVISPEILSADIDEEIGLSVGGSFDIIKGGWETEYVDISLLDVGHAEVSMTPFGGKALASVWSPSIAFNLFGCNIEIGAEVLSVGGGGKKTDKYIEISLSVLFGGTIKITKN